LYSLLGAESGENLGSVEILPCTFNNIMGSFFHFFNVPLTIYMIY